MDTDEIIKILFIVICIYVLYVFIYGNSTVKQSVNNSEQFTQPKIFIKKNDKQKCDVIVSFKDTNKYSESYTDDFKSYAEEIAKQYNYTDPEDKFQSYTDEIQHNREDKQQNKENKFTNTQPYNQITQNKENKFTNIQLNNRITQNKEEKDNKKCSLETCGTEGLHPVLNPEFNMREVAKQCLLLEDHINNKKKRCLDCIKKHFLMIDGLLEEAVSLEKDNKKRDYYRDLYLKWVDIEKQYVNNTTDLYNMDEISKIIRSFRKPLANEYFEIVSEY